MRRRLLCCLIDTEGRRHEQLLGLTSNSERNLFQLEIAADVSPSSRPPLEKEKKSRSTLHLFLTRQLVKLYILLYTRTAIALSAWSEFYLFPIFPTRRDNNIIYILFYDIYTRVDRVSIQHIIITSRPFVLVFRF